MVAIVKLKVAHIASNYIALAHAQSHQTVSIAPASAHAIKDGGCCGNSVQVLGIMNKELNKIHRKGSITDFGVLESPSGGVF